MASWLAADTQLTVVQFRNVRSDCSCECAVWTVNVCEQVWKIALLRSFTQNQSFIAKPDK